MVVKHKTISPVDIEEIALIRVNDFIRNFVKHTLLIDCYKLSITKDKPITDKATFNKNNWNNKGHVKSNMVHSYEFGFNAKPEPDRKTNSAFFMKYQQLSKEIQGKVYYSNGNIIRIVISSYGDKETMLALIKFHADSYRIVDNYYRLSLASLTDVHPSNRYMSGRIECSFYIKSGNQILEYVISDEQYGPKVIAAPTSHGASRVLQTILRSAVGRRDGFYKNFMIKFEKNSKRSIISIKLHNLQKVFPDFPKLSELVDSECFDDYLKVVEMSQI